VLSTGEEQGLLGARHLAQLMQTADVDVLNMDIVGDPTGHQLADGANPRDDGRVRVFSEALPRELSAEGLAGLRASGGENDSMSRQLARYVYETGSLYGTRLKPMLIQRADRFLRGGDHTPFNEMGKAGVRFTQVFENYDRQHQLVAGGKGDTLEFVDPRYLAGVTELVATTALRLAAAPRPPVTVELVIADLTHDTTLRWKASPSSSAVTYTVVWRETTSPVWTDSVSAGANLVVTLPLNKDNYFFGVRAVVADGNMGLVRPAVPVRK
jgi:Zn-dependent M28 family amino/carboxypeptidase